MDASIVINELRIVSVRKLGSPGGVPFKLHTLISHVYIIPSVATGQMHELELFKERERLEISDTIIVWLYTNTSKRATEI